MEKLTYRQFLKTDVELSVLGVMRAEGHAGVWTERCGRNSFLLCARLRRDGVCRQPDERAGGLRASGR